MTVLPCRLISGPKSIHKGPEQGSAEQGCTGPASPVSGCRGVFSRRRVPDICSRNRSGNGGIIVEALGQAAVFLKQHIHLGLRFHALGHALYALLAADASNVAHQGAAHRIVDDIDSIVDTYSSERSIKPDDLDAITKAVGLQPLQVRSSVGQAKERLGMRSMRKDVMIAKSVLARLGLIERNLTSTPRSSEDCK